MAGFNAPNDNQAIIHDEQWQQGGHCEQAIKMSIRHRRNSLFYKSERGARVGDAYMSLIHTGQHSHVDPFDYLTQLQRHHERVAASPADWMHVTPSSVRT
jgi:hypothetical protein